MLYVFLMKMRNESISKIKCLHYAFNMFNVPLITTKIINRKLSNESVSYTLHSGKLYTGKSLTYGILPDMTTTTVIKTQVIFPSSGLESNIR